MIPRQHNRCSWLETACGFIPTSWTSFVTHNSSARTSKCRIRSRVSFANTLTTAAKPLDETAVRRVECAASLARSAPRLISTVPIEEPEKTVPEEPLAYLEGGLLVYTAAYHLKRGHCCGSGCRHCPYAPRHVEGSTEVRP
jgi:hypothetical protein